MSTIGFFGIQAPDSAGPGAQRDKSYLPKFKELIGPGHSLKGSISEFGVEFFNSFASKAKAADLDSVITTDQSLLTLILKALPDYKQAYNKNGAEKKLSLNDYHGSFIELPGHTIGRTRPLDVLFLNPLEHLRTVPEGEFVFKRFISKITKPEKWFPQTAFTWELATQANIQFLYQQFQTAQLIASDIETVEGSDLRTIDCCGFAALFPDGTSHTVVIPVTSMWGVEWMRKFNGLRAPKCYQNGLYDNLYKLRYNSPVYNWLYDTQNLFHSWFSELPKRLDFITAFALRRVRFWKDDGKSGNKTDHYEYNARDCWATLNSCLSLLLEMPPYAIQNYLLEFPLVFPCLHCEVDGLRVNKIEFERSKTEVQGKLEPLEQQLGVWFGPDFNPASPPQVKNLLKVLGCADRQGNVKSSDEKALVAASAAHPLNERILSAILEVRGYRKLLSTYLEASKFWDWRLHFKLNPAGTDTGRLASTESSFWCGLQIQNIPQRDGTIIRRFLETDEGWLLGEGDYAQSEARCIAYLAGCEPLIELVESEHDYHAWNAAKFFGVPYEQIYDEAAGKTLNKKLRDLSKRTNHGANFGMGAGVMLETMGPKMVAEAKQILKLPVKWNLVEVCEHLLGQYANTYPEVKKDLVDWIKRTIGITKRLVSPLGWTRYFFSNPNSNKQALNAAVAHGPQNLSVTVINEVFYKIWHKSVYGELRGRVRIKAQIHDSILFAYKGDEVPALVQQLMVNPVTVKDIKGKERRMLIPPTMVAGAEFWGELK